MSSYFGINADTSSSFFGGFFGNNTSATSSSGSLNLGDYALIKSGSYKKLLQKYYKENGDTKETTGTGAASSTKPVDSTANLLSSKTAAGTLKDSATDLKNVDYTSTNRDELLKKAKAFVKDYNDTLDSLKNLESVSVLQNGVWMTNQTKKNDNMLASAGITVGADNKLSLDETVFKDAKVSDIKSAFSGSGSWADSVAQRANQIYTLSGTQALINQRTSSYSSNGGYNTLSTSQLFNSLL